MSAENEQPDYRLEVLRAAGHGDAADLLSKLPGQAPAVEPEQEKQQEPQRPMTPAEAHEAQRQAEGQAFLEALNASRSKNSVTIDARSWL